MVKPWPLPAEARRVAVALEKVIEQCEEGEALLWWAEAVQLAADDAEYRQYKMELDVIRAKYDPHRDLSEPTSISPEYRNELSALHDKHQAMLERKFGPR